MPIKGLTDEKSLVPRFRRLGKLRKGGEKSGGTYGADLDHFRFTGENGDEAIEAAFTDIFGDQPKILHVYLPHKRPEENFQTWKEKWSAASLLHRCDGEMTQIFLTPDGKYSKEPRPCPGGCDEVGRLEFIIPELMDYGFIGTVVLETHSIHDILHIAGVLAKTAEYCGNRPEGLQGILFTLRRVEEKISTPGWGDNKGKRQSVKKWLVKIEPAVDWVQSQMALTRNDQPALAVEKKQEALPAPVEAMTEEEAKTIKTKRGMVVWDLDESQLEAILTHLEAHPPKDDTERKIAEAAAWRLGQLSEPPFDVG